MSSESPKSDEDNVLELAIGLANSVLSVITLKEGRFKVLKLEVYREDTIKSLTRDGAMNGEFSPASLSQPLQPGKIRLAIVFEHERTRRRVDVTTSSVVRETGTLSHGGSFEITGIDTLPGEAKKDGELPSSLEDDQRRVLGPMIQALESAINAVLNVLHLEKKDRRP